MTDPIASNRLAERRDFINLPILLLICLAIGVYLIVTTVVISNDGVFYIERARAFSSDPVFIKAHPPGYPFLIFAAHKFVTLFNNSSSVYGWIYSAQGVTLLCRVLSLVPLYFIGKLLVGSRKSFWAVLILVVLPYPARFGSDIMRDWPHILFLAIGYLLLLLGGQRGKWGFFFGAGMLSGAGYLIRVESVQLIIYGLAWLTAGVFCTKRNMSRPKLVLATLVLVGGFALTGGWCMWIRGTAMTPKLDKFIKSFVMDTSKAHNQIHLCQNTHRRLMRAEFVPEDFVQGSFGYGLVKIAKRISENLMYCFTLPLIIGLYLHIRSRRFMEMSQFLMVVFILLNMAVLLILHRCYGYISRRHVLPLVVFTIFVVPDGLRVCAVWLDNIFSKRLGKVSGDDNGRFWFYVLLVAGITICIPKLLSPLRKDKKVYKEVSTWLQKNTTERDVIMVQDRRISFYAERKSVLEHRRKIVPKKATYIVHLFSDDKAQLLPLWPDTVAVKKYSTNYVKRNKQVPLAIYKITSRGVDMKTEENSLSAP